MAVVMPRGRPYTVDDLDHFPDDGNRYELIEGSLHVTPGPAMPHQDAIGRLHLLLHAACPPEMKVWLSPLDVVFTRETVLQPDVFVLPVDAPSGKRVVTVPLLAVEVLSPSTRSYDQVLKRRVYEEAGVGAYWVVDTTRPSVHAWTWAAGEVDERAAEGDEALEVTWPFPVTVVPSELA
jgi:Uma2 family endonuclease